MSAVGTGGESDAVYCGTTYRIASIGVSSDSVTFDANGGRKTISVWANAEWEVQSKPDWVTATKTTIQSGDHSEVVLEIAVGVTSSEREGTIKLVAAKGTPHQVVSSDIHVVQSAEAGPTPPAWTPVTKEDTLVVYATVFDASANVAMEADGTRLGAFAANGECRGWVTIMDGPNGRLFQLSVGVESSTEGGIVLKLWNPDTGEVVEIPERISCNSDRQIGTIANPRIFRIGALELAVNLKEGWNWISTCLVADDSSVDSVFAGCAFANDDVVKTSNGSATYYNGTWYPAPASFKIEPGVAYVVKKSAGGAETATLRGTLMDDGIAVKAGWNWIGVTRVSAQAISSVRHSVGFADNDVVKASGASATYYEGQWYPPTFSFSPGVGYKMNLAKSGTLSFASSASSVPSPVANMSGDASHDGLEGLGWSPVTQEDTMVAYLQVKKPDGTGNFESAGSMLAAFSSSGECRGVVEVMDGPVGKIYQLSIGVASATESGFTLKLWDPDSQQVYSIKETLACNSDKLIGKIVAPEVLTVAVTPAYDVTFNANGGVVGEASRRVAEGNELGELPVPTRDGNAFTGWYTAREGGFKVSPETKMVGYGVTLYAHWEPLAAGSCPAKAIAFPFGPSVATYPVTLAKEWLEKEGRYDDASGVLYCKSSVARGKVYTIALPVGQAYEVVCGDAGVIVEYATFGALRYCVVDARDLAEETAELALALSGGAGSRTTVYVVEGNLVPAGAEYEDPDPGDLPGSCLGRAMGLEFGAGVRARTVRLLHEWDEVGAGYLAGGVRYLAAVSPASGRLTVAVPAAAADGCEVSCAGNAVAGPELSSGLAFWIFDAQAGDEVVVRLSGTRGADATVYTFGGDFLAKRLFFDPNGGTCPVESKEVRAGAPVGELPVPDDRAGHFFLGWFTAREGGARVTAATVMVGYDVTLYAHWEKLVAGSSQEAAIPFAMTTRVVAYPVALAKEWLEDELRYSDADGAFYCKTTLTRGKVYTMAVPRGLGEVDAWCVNGEASVTFGSDASLQYVRFDTTNMAADETTAYFAVFDDAGRRTTIYAVEADVMPR